MVREEEGAGLGQAPLRGVDVGVVDDRGDENDEARRGGGSGEGQVQQVVGGEEGELVEAHLRRGQGGPGGGDVDTSEAAARCRRECVVQRRCRTRPTSRPG